MNYYSFWQRSMLTLAVASIGLVACQEGGYQASSNSLTASASGLAVQTTVARLGDALTYPGLQPHHIPDDVPSSKYAARMEAGMATGGWTMDTSNRQLVRGFYNSVYMASHDTPIEWTGSQSTCTPGDTSSNFKNAVLARINYYRAMVGIPANITFNATFNAKAQQAALMMSANNTLDHYPPNTWSCYTADGSQAAGSSNLSLGTGNYYGWHAVDGQIRDAGSHNTAVGHRRWLLYPQTQVMGTGDVAAAGSYGGANAVWVMDGNYGAARPVTRDDFVAWPTKGYNPYQLVPARWSFSYPGANFAAASVTVSQSGTAIPVTLEPLSGGMGENTLVWRLNAMSDNATWAKPSSDTTYQVTVNNVVVGGVSRSFTYDVIIFDPQVADASEQLPAVSGNATPAAGSSQTYAFTPVSFAAQHETLVAEVANATGSYNAETGSLTVVDKTDSSYTLLYSGAGANGTTVYRLAPVTPLEAVEFADSYIPTASSVLQFSSQLGFAKSTQKAAIQISLDDGSSWNDIYSLVGTGSTSNPTESSFSNKTVNLSAYAGRLVKFRAIYERGSSWFIGTGTNVSFLLDNVQVTNAKRVATATKQLTSGSTIALTPVSGKEYALAARAQPWTGHAGLDWSPVFFVNPVAACAANSSSVETSPVMTIPQNKWTMFSLPLNPGSNNQVQQILDELPASGYNIRWVVYEVNNATMKYTKLALTSAMQSGKAYWMIYLDGTVNVTMQGTRVTADSLCYFDTVLYANTAKNGENAVGNPYRAAFNWADVRVKVGGSHLTLATADSNNVLNASFKRTPNGSSADRNAYSYDMPQTSGTIQPWEAIWVTTKSAFASGTLLSLPAPNP